MLEKMLSLIRSQEVCVLATAGPDGAPHCSFMFYAWDEGGRIIRLLTRAGARKFANLAANPAVSLLIDTRGEAAQGGQVVALTVTGQARDLAPGPERERALAALLARHPILGEIAVLPDARVVEVAARGLQLLEGPTGAAYASLG